MKTFGLGLAALSLAFTLAAATPAAPVWTEGKNLIKAYGIDRTPTIVVNGKYRLHVQSVGGPDEVIELVKWLVAKESK
jgi:hypothetical protein